MHVLFVDESTGPIAALASDVACKYGWDVVVATSDTAVGPHLEAGRWDAVIVGDTTAVDGLDAMARARAVQPSATRLYVRTDPAAEVDTLAVAENAHRVLDDVPGCAGLNAMLAAMSAAGMRVPQPLADAVGAVAGLPSVAKIVQDVRLLMEDPSASPERVARVIKTQPTLAAKVLHLANAGLVATSGPVYDLAQAAALLGMNVLQQVVLASAAFNGASAMGVDPEVIEVAQTHGVAAARAATAMANVPGYTATGGLLLDIGLPLMAIAWPEEHARLRAACRQDGLPLHQEERRELGTSHAEAGALLARRWSLPTEVARMIAGHHFVPQAPQAETRSLGFVLHHAAQQDESGRDPFDPAIAEAVPEWVTNWPAAPADVAEPVAAPA